MAPPSIRYRQLESLDDLSARRQVINCATYGDSLRARAAGQAYAEASGCLDRDDLMLSPISAETRLQLGGFQPTLMPHRP